MVTNNGLLPTTKLKVTLTGSAAFTKTADGCAGKFLWPRKTCSVTVRYGPTSAGSTDTGTLTVAAFKVSASAALTGKSTAADVPDDPVVDTSAGDTSYTENAASTSIDSALTVTDPDSGATITGATVAITDGYAGAEDILALAGSHPGITAAVSGDTLTLTGTASPAAYQAALRDVTYRNSSDSPSTAARTITFTVTDETSRSGSDSKGLTVVAVDDPPVAVNDSATVDEDAAPSSIPVLANDTDVDGGPRTIALITQPANGTVAISGGGTGLTYEPDQDYCNTEAGGTPDTFTYTLNGGSTATVSVTVVCVPESADISITVAGAGNSSICPPGWLLNVTNHGPSDAVVEILKDFSAAGGTSANAFGTWEIVTASETRRAGAIRFRPGRQSRSVADCNPTGVTTIEVYSSSVPDPDSTPNNGTSNGEDDQVVVVGSGPT